MAFEMNLKHNDPGEPDRDGDHPLDYFVSDGIPSLYDSYQDILVNVLLIIMTHNYNLGFI